MPGRTLEIRTPSQWEAITSPLRAELIELLGARDPASVGELAEALGRPADRLYHHVHLLEEAGLIEVAGHRPTQRRPEALYRLVANDFRLGDPDGPLPADELKRLQRTHGRRAERVFAEAVDAQAFRWGEEPRRAHMRSDTAHLSKDDLAAVQEHLAAVREIFARARPSTEGDLVSLTVTMAPVVGRDLPSPRKS